ncbi:MAG: transcription-repair coupling factor [Bacteroidales bacterium]|jgi:transcription-repair coupling factor (superfamily II helicase)|nr:transcription-repair coupling factor [Bacteroidales bacterium]
MKIENLLALYSQTQKIQTFVKQLSSTINRTKINGLNGSSRSLFGAASASLTKQLHLFVLSDKEAAAFFYSDLEQIFQEEHVDFSQRQSVFFPELNLFSQETNASNNFDVLLRTKTMQRIEQNERLLVVTCPEAVMQKVTPKETLNQDTCTISRGENLSMDFILEYLYENNFEYTDFVCQPGQFSVRGGIIDVFSYANEYPYRIEFFGDTIASLRTFEVDTQLSKSALGKIIIIPDLQSKENNVPKTNLFDILPANTVLWFDDIAWSLENIQKKYNTIYETLTDKSLIHDLCIDDKQFKDAILHFRTVEFGTDACLKIQYNLSFDTHPQMPFNKQFDLLINEWLQNYEQGIVNIFSSLNENQSLRVRNIVRDILLTQEKYADLQEDYRKKLEKEMVSYVSYTLHEGFIDREQKIAFYTDHQVFNRYHRYKVNDKYKKSDAIMLKDIYNLQQGDYITHIDHGIGQYAGLEKIEINGKQQEAIKIIYKGNDILYISIHSLHRIAKYSGKDGEVPALNRLGSNAWTKIKERTKTKVKELVIDLTKLYAERKLTEGFSFSTDNYMQTELEASFIYEDTPDQTKATQDVKNDMEANYPMDRLICGDVGFGKTEIAIRAAFKAVCDNKQVAVLVPTTILALQHYNTFRDRLADFPCRVDYINRFRSKKQQKTTLENLKNGKVDIIIGTHRLLGKDIGFKDLGLLIVDEEQKFGVGAKEKLRSLKINVDTIILTATPIPRTLQFSLMGARDISIMQTPPLNRYPIQTEVHLFSEELIKSAIEYEISRGGQVFVVHNRIQNIGEIADMIRKHCPEQKVAVAHGQMDGDILERIMLDFIDGYYDVLISTTIIESGLDIPNANTMIINNAQNYGLSELHQLRGRVGRKNKKAFCYLLTPPLSTVSDTARKRLRAIEEFSDIGSGFNIAMRDLDIRGAGNLLGAEQSGFITEIGYEMYQKILEEAIDELHRNNPDAKDLPDNIDRDFVKDCVIETDMEILIPDTYIVSSSERYSLYKELNNLSTDEELDIFRDKLTDRFGKIPQQTEELIKTIGLRKMAKEMGFEKIALKQGKLIGYFLQNTQSDYYQSPQFLHIIDVLQHNATLGYLRQNKEKLTITLNKIYSIEKAIISLQPFVMKVMNCETSTPNLA